LIKHNSDFTLTAIPANILGDIDLDVIKQAREIVTNATLAEIMREEPHGPSAFREAVRQQVLTLCVRLRISLIVIDKLMAVANALAAKIEQ
jgi:hypothetical protein